MIVFESCNRYSVAVKNYMNDACLQLIVFASLMGLILEV